MQEKFCCVIHVTVLAVRTLPVNSSSTNACVDKIRRCPRHSGDECKVFRGRKHDSSK